MNLDDHRSVDSGCCASATKVFLPEMKTILWSYHSYSTTETEGPGYLVKLETMAPGDFEDWHFHKEVHQLFHVLKGELEVRTPTQKQRLKPGESFWVKKLLPHSVYNPGNEETEFRLFSTGNTAEDRYGMDYPYPPRKGVVLSGFELVEYNDYQRTAVLELSSEAASPSGVQDDLEKLFITYGFRKAFFKKGNDKELSAKKWIDEHPELQVVPWQPKWSQAFRELNEEWITHYFVLEEGDRKTLNEPEKEVIEPGGMIFLVLFRGEPVSTGALMWNELDELELTKMATRPAFQGLGLGAMIIDQSIRWAREQGIRELYLYTQSSLYPALRLYEAKGFRYIKLSPGHYIRADVKMRLDLTKTKI